VCVVVRCVVDGCPAAHLFGAQFHQHDEPRQFAYEMHVILNVQLVGDPTPGFFLDIADNEYVVSPADPYFHSLSSERSVDNGAFLENQINHIGSRFPTLSVSVFANSVVGNLRLSGITASGLAITRSLRVAARRRSTAS
jgi:hypothetical protein